jgi:hypothetical protein
MDCWPVTYRSFADLAGTKLLGIKCLCSAIWRPMRFGADWRGRSEAAVAAVAVIRPDLAQNRRSRQGIIEVSVDRHDRLS